MFRFLHDEASGAMGYLLADDDAREAVLIDPRGDDVPALRSLLVQHRLRLRWILRTHEHDAMLLRESSALVMLGAPVIVARPHFLWRPDGSRQLPLSALAGVA